jgi:putative transposase
VALTDAQRHELEALIRRHSAPQQLVFRARIILAAADGLGNAPIARRLGTSAVTARLWRTRWVGLSGVPDADLSAEDRLADAPRAGRPPRITPEQVCAIVALACEAPARSGRPITHWSGREIADEVRSSGIVARISPRHAGRLLKTAGPPAAPRAALADAGAR